MQRSHRTGLGVAETISFRTCLAVFERNGSGYPNFRSATRNPLVLIRVVHAVQCLHRRLGARQLSEAGKKRTHTSSQAGNPFNTKIGTRKDGGKERAIPTYAGRSAAIWRDESPGRATTYGATPSIRWD